MIGKVLRGEADLAITDLTINSARIEALDFTPSFMNLGKFHMFSVEFYNISDSFEKLNKISQLLGIALLYRKPSVVAPTTFAFMVITFHVFRITLSLYSEFNK